MLLLILVAGQMAVGAPGDSGRADLLSQRESEAWRLIARLQSPFCPGLTLEACPSWQAETLRTTIRRRMAQGESTDRIRGDLVATFGQRILGEPTWDGFDVFGWLLPGVLLLLCSVALMAWFRGRHRGIERGGGEPLTAPLEHLATAERVRLEELLRRELAESEDRP
ncbi:MAG TPA: cytochrome c-type biogenesis protein CcmH [Gemmatimonadales bacterium]|jgi:cytochrome c-type biogenesis protein CcmH|nr:cytochrome c-type biogenesis protein CcmH [Gemmatimonadales bacterium]